MRCPVALISWKDDIDASGNAMRWSPLVVGTLAAVVAACSGGPMSETESVEGLNALVIEAGSDLEASLAAYEQIADPTLA
jgi:hypothetical protein